jgi:hypothetical protein
MECAYLYSLTARCSFSYYAWTRGVTGWLIISALGRTVHNVALQAAHLLPQGDGSDLTIALSIRCLDGLRFRATDWQ